VKAAEDFFAAFRWEETLDIADEKDQHAQQNSDLDDIVQKELEAADPAISGVETEGGKQSAKQVI
jgi:hypothetical protein